MTMQFIHTLPNTGAWNMQLDETLARNLVTGSGIPTVRLYSWEPWAISLGFNQDPLSIDATLCAADGIDIVRRPTGGRAVFHAQELTYSVVMPARIERGMKAGGIAGDKSVLEIYNHISRALVRGLQLFGANVTLVKSQPDFREHYKHASSIPCFTASARYEIEYDGKKLVGSAQRRFRNPDTGEEVVLQHGSILTGPAHRDLVKYVVLEDERTRESLGDELIEKTIDISQITGMGVDMNALAEAMRRGFEEQWDVQFKDTAVSTLDLIQVHA